MRKTIVKLTANSDEETRPAINPDARQNQLISLAVNLAEKQLKEGTASSQVITHFLKLATKKEEVELEKIQIEKELLRAKINNLESNKQTAEKFEEAIKAMKSYQGLSNGEDIVDEY